MIEPTWECHDEDEKMEDVVRNEEAEARVAETVDLVESSSREAESVLSNFWSSVRDVRNKLASQGVVMPEQLDRRR